MGLGCPLLLGSSARRLRRCAATLTKKAEEHQVYTMKQLKVYAKFCCVKEYPETLLARLFFAPSGTSSRNTKILSWDADESNNSNGLI